MKTVVLGLLAFATLTSASPARVPPAIEAEAPGPSSLMEVMQRAEFAEIYLISRSIIFAVAPRVATVRHSGCRYFIYRNSPQWRELERALADADIRIVPGAASGEVRVAFILGDHAGTLWEAYARYPFPSESTVPGFSQRRQVAFSAGFVLALEMFVEQHPDLALPVAGPVSHCPAAVRERRP
jgi:hypothetical protein